MNMIYCNLARYVRHRVKRRWGARRPHHLHHHTGGNAHSPVKIMSLSPSSDTWSWAFTSLHPSNTLPSVSCFSSTSTVWKRFVSPSHTGTSVAKRNIQIGIITQLLLALLSFPVMRPVGIDTRDLQHKGRTTRATWSYVLLEFSAASPGFHPALHKTGTQTKGLCLALTYTRSIY